MHIKNKPKKEKAKEEEEDAKGIVSNLCAFILCFKVVHIILFKSLMIKCWINKTPTLKVISMSC